MSWAVSPGVTQDVPVPRSHRCPCPQVAHRCHTGVPRCPCPQVLKQSWDFPFPQTPLVALQDVSPLSPLSPGVPRVSGGPPRCVPIDPRCPHVPQNGPRGHSVPLSVSTLPSRAVPNMSLFPFGCPQSVPCPPRGSPMCPLSPWGVPGESWEFLGDFWGISGEFGVPGGFWGPWWGFGVPWGGSGEVLGNFEDFSAPPDPAGL